MRRSATSGQHRRGAPGPHWAVRSVLVLLVTAQLLVSFSGHAGIQVLDRALTARLAELHLHGVAGEASYVAAYQQPAPFVHTHCHDALFEAGVQPGPDEVVAASALASTAGCPPATALPDQPAVVQTSIFPITLVTAGTLVLVPHQPPRITSPLGIAA